MAGSKPFDPARRFELVVGSRPYYVDGLGAGADCSFYTFNLGGALGDKLTLDAGSLVSGVLFSTLNGATGLNPAFAGTYANAASDSPADLASAFHQVDIAEAALNYICDETFSGAIWSYRVNGVWVQVDQGVPTDIRSAYFFNGVNQYGRLSYQYRFEAGHYIEVDIDERQPVNTGYLSSATTGDLSRVLILGNGDIEVSRTFDGLRWVGVAPPVGERVLLRAVNLGSSIELFVNGVPQGAKAATGVITIGLVGVNQNATGLFCTGAIRKVDLNGDVYTLSDKSSSIQKSETTGGEISLINYDPENWGYINE